MCSWQQLETLDQSDVVLIAHELEVSGFTYSSIMPSSHMEVGSPGTWGLELLTPGPSS